MRKYIILLLCVGVRGQLYSAEGGPEENVFKRRKLENLYEKHGDRECKCLIPGCGLVVANRNVFQDHIDTFHRKYYNPQSARRGQRILSSEEKARARKYSNTRVTCPECGKEYNRSSLKGHLETQHDMKQFYTCSICGRDDFDTKLKKTLHMKEEHCKDVSGLFEDDAEKKDVRDQVAEEVGIYSQWDDSDKVFLTEDQSYEMKTTVSNKIRSFKDAERAYNKKVFEEAVKETFLKKFSPEKTARWMDLYRIIYTQRNEEGWPIRDQDSYILVKDHEKITIKRDQQKDMNEVFKSLTEVDDEGLARYGTKDEFRKAFKKATGKYYQTKFDEKVHELALDGERELTDAEEKTLDELQTVYKGLKIGLRELFDKLPLHGRDKEYQLKHGTYKVID